MNPIQTKQNYTTLSFSFSKNVLNVFFFSADQVKTFVETFLD